MTNTNDIEKNEKPRRNANQPQGHIELRTNYNGPSDDIDVEDILDVMGCKTRRDIINLLREEPMFVSKYYDLQNEVNIHITINRNNFDVQFTDDMLNTLQLPSGDEWSKLLDIEKRIDDGQLEAIDELRNQIRLYGNLLERAEYILERGGANA